MKTHLSLFIGILLFSSSILQAQTFPGSTGALTDNNCSGAFNTFSATVSGVGVTDVIQSVTINISHSWVGDLNLFLVGPTGTIIELSTVNGGSGDNYTNTIFSDSAPSYITTGTAPFTSSFKPEGRTNNDSQCDPTGIVGTYTFASQFGGTNPNGNWTLKIKDGSPSDIGILNSWSVTIVPMPTLQKVGINTVNPQATLDVNGKVKIGNDVSQQAAGMIRYSTLLNDFEGFNGSLWKSMTGTGTGTANKRINDADNNTSVDVETNPNENIIRFSLNGTERYTMYPGRFDMNSIDFNTFLGKSVGVSNTTGTNNTGIGFNTLLSNSSGCCNTAIGAEVLNINTTGWANSAVGSGSLNRNTTGFWNTATGASSLYYNTTGNYNTAIGESALTGNTTGSNNTAVGKSSLSGNIVGNRNSAFGQAALINSNGEDNTSIGYGSLLNNTSGNNNTALGKEAGKLIANGSANQTSNSSIYIGVDTRASQNGNTNEIVIGNGTLGAGSNTITIGNTQTLSTILKGAVSYFPIGTNAGETGQLKLHELSANGTNNITLKVPDNIANNINFTLPSTAGTTGQVLSTNGAGILDWVTTSGGGSGNGLVHPTAGSTYESGTNLPGITGTNNTAIGVGAGSNITNGDYNTAFGKNTLNNTDNGINNTAFGYNALSENFYSANSAFGSEALELHFAGTGNCAFGSQALKSQNNGSDNCAFGALALKGNIQSDYNSAFGTEALRDNTYGIRNCAFGERAMIDNTTGGFNIAIGAHSFVNSGNNYFQSISIGWTSAITASYQARIGNSNTTSIGGYEPWTDLSDSRFKKNIHDNVVGIEFIKKLIPVTYQLDVVKLNEFLNIPDSLRDFNGESIKTQQIRHGFLAQDVEEAANSLGFDFNGVDKPKNEKDHYGLRYSVFVVPLVKAVQEQQVMIDKLIKENQILNEYKAGFQTENTVLREDIKQLASELKALREMILNK